MSALLGEALVALVVLGALLSLLLGGGLYLLARRLRRPELRATLLRAGLVLPPVLALALVTAAAIPAFAPLFGPDLVVATHHPHSLGFHGLTGPLPLALVVPLTLLAFLAFLVIRDLVLWWRAVGAARHLAELGQPLSPETPETIVVDGPHTPLCLNVDTDRGWRVVLSKVFADHLDGEELRAVIAHERAHLAHGNNLTLLSMGLAARFHLPWIGRRLATSWRQTVELLCDREAAEQTRRPLELASALVRAHRLLQRATFAPSVLGGLTVSGDVQRIERLLGMSATELGEPTGRQHSPWLVALTLAAGTLLLSAPVHHALETLLAWILG